MVAAAGVEGRRRRLRVGLNVAAQLGLVFWLLLVVNSWGFRQSWRFDWTRDQRYEVPDETQKILGALAQDVEVIFPYVRTPSSPGAIEYEVLFRGIRACREFEMVAPRFRVVDVVDLGRDPAKEALLKEQRRIDVPNRIYLISGEAREVLAADDLAEIRHATPANPEAKILREYAGEAVSNALLRLVQRERPKVCFSYGSGEILPGHPREGRSLEAFVRALRDRGFDLSGIDLRTAGEIPADIRLLVVIAGGSTSDYQPLPQPARSAVAAFVERGGGLLLFLPTEGVCGLEAILKSTGIQPRGVQGEFVAMRLARPGGPVDSLALEARGFNASHPIASAFRYEDFRAELNLQRPLTVESPGEVVLTSDPSSWLETNPKQPRRDFNEALGAYPLVAAYAPGEVNAEGAPRGRVVVFGSWTAALDVYFGGDLRRLLLNSVYWLTDRATLAAGVGRDPTSDRVDLSGPLLPALFWSVIVATPFAALLGGLVVFWMRRR